MDPHEYGRYLHILTPEASDKQHGAQPWEGITGRVKYLQKQETKTIMTEIKRSNAAVNLRINENMKAMEANRKTMEAKLERIEAMENMKAVEVKLQGVESKLENRLKRIEAMLSKVLDPKQ